jgi:DNA-binding MarR family transcriptional regulator
MDTEKACSALRSLIRVRTLLDDALSPASSLIPIDLLLAASCAQSPGKHHLTVKQLFAQLRHSDRAVRMHFNRLVADGMIIAEPGAGDRRTKIVRLSPRGEKLLMRAAAALLQAGERTTPSAAKPAGRSGAAKSPGKATRRTTR